MRLKALQRWRERQAEGQLDARGLSIKDHYRKHHASLVKSLEKRGEDAQFFLDLQEQYHSMEDRLKQSNLPPGGADEILTQRFYPLSDAEQWILES